MSDFSAEIKAVYNQAQMMGRLLTGSPIDYVVQEVQSLIAKAEVAGAEELTKLLIEYAAAHGEQMSAVKGLKLYKDLKAQEDDRG